VVHVQVQRKAHFVIQLLAVESGEVQGEPLELQHEHLWHLGELDALESISLLVALLALVLVVAAQLFDIQEVLQSLLDGLVLNVFKFIFDGQLEVEKSAVDVSLEIAGLALDEVGVVALIDVGDHTIYTVLLERGLDGVEKLDAKFLDVVLLHCLLVVPLKGCNQI
jgi:hypothetical protein